MTMYERISAGAYKTTLPWPSRPKLPELLTKNVAKITAEEYAIVPKVKADYAAAQETYETEKKAHATEAIAILTRFVNDLEEEFGTKGNPKASVLYAKAWERGHSGGLGEVYIAYEDLVELVK